MNTERLWVIDLDALKLPSVSQITQWLHHKQRLLLTQNCNKLYLMWHSSTPPHLNLPPTHLSHFDIYATHFLFRSRNFHMLCISKWPTAVTSYSGWNTQGGKQTGGMWLKPDTLLHLIKGGSVSICRQILSLSTPVDISWCRNIYYKDFCAAIWIMYTVLQFKEHMTHLFFRMDGSTWGWTWN